MSKLQQELKERDIRFDVLKGIATIIVVFGHVLQYCTKGYEDTFVFNVIWSLQIPLFMVVSGYFSVSTNAVTFDKLWHQIVRYIWPCITYFILLCVIYHYPNPLNSAMKLLWHLEGTLWYLVVLAFLSIFNYVAERISSKATYFGGGLYTVSFFIMAILFALPGLRLGLTFLGIKYVLYYSLFYWMGNLWHRAKQYMTEKNAQASSVYDILFTIASVIYFVIIFNVNLYQTNDDLFGIAPRLVASICGVYIVSWLVMRASCVGLVAKNVASLGTISLEVYYIHCVIVRALKPVSVTTLSTEWIIIVMVEFAFVLLVTIGVISCVKKSDALCLLLFGIPPKRNNNK